MRAIVQHRYGGPETLALAEVPAPTPTAEQVLVRVRASSVHPDVWHVVRGRPLVLRLMGAGLLRPRWPTPGTDVAGVVEAVGRDVRRFRLGDEVFGETVAGFQWKHGGAFAELCAVRERDLELKPDGVSFEQAASVPTAGLIALRALRVEGQLRSARRVLVNGAAGNVGAVAVQIAKAAGAHVTAVDAAAKLDVLRALGADEVVDYATSDITRSDGRFDLLLDVASTLRFAAAKRILTDRGIYVAIGHDHFGKARGRVFGSLPQMLGLAARSLLTRHVPRLTAAPHPEDEPPLVELRRLLAEGRLTPLVDRTFPLADAAEALRYLETGSARGRIVLTV